MTTETDTQNVPTLIEFILDETGSMASCLQGAIAGFNTFLSEQSNQSGECYFTLTKFSTSQKLTVYSDLDIKMVPQINDGTYKPDGGTNLYDVIVERIGNLKQRISTWDITPRVLVVCLTDGEDNSSRLNPNDVKTQINALDNWSFVYLGANHNATSIAHKLGFPENNVKTFEVSKISQTMEELSSRTTAYRSGTVSAKSFYGEQK